MKPGKNLVAARLGQARILEAVVASLIIFTAFSAAFYFIYSSENVSHQETVDLNRLAYNALHQIAESAVIEETVEEDPQSGQNQLKTILQELLPANIYFNLTIYNCTGNPHQPYGGNPISISNAPPEALAESGEVASASIIYTSKRGSIYNLVLRLTRAGM